MVTLVYQRVYPHKNGEFYTSTCAWSRGPVDPYLQLFETPRSAGFDTRRPQRVKRPGQGQLTKGPQ